MTFRPMAIQNYVDSFKDCVLSFGNYFLDGFYFFSGHDVQSHDDFEIFAFQFLQGYLASLLILELKSQTLFAMLVPNCWIKLIAFPSLLA